MKNFTIYDTGRISYDAFMKCVDAGESFPREFACSGSLSDCRDYIGRYVTADDANEWPIRAPLWLNFSDECPFGFWMREFSLHIPEHVTPSSRRRIARLFGLKTATD